MKVEIDAKSGFCFGVTNAISQAERLLRKYGKLYCLGEIVHNQKEIERLEKAGMVIIDNEEFKNLHDSVVIIRAHGEPPETYQIAKKNNITLVDATCPVVLGLQKRIKKSSGGNGQNGRFVQVVIYGKENHPEVIGLKGHVDENCFVVKDITDLNKLDFSKPIRLFSQTTQSKHGFYLIKKEIERKIEDLHIKNPDFVITESICGQVSNRRPELQKFCSKYNLILFIAGKNSSNGRILYEHCQQQNSNAYYIQDIDDIKEEWFNGVDSVGICGATSTPHWLLEKVAEYVKSRNGHLD